MPSHRLFNLFGPTWPRAMTSGGFDAEAMARALIVDPAFVRRLAEEEAALSLCDHCDYCAARIYATSMACHERDEPSPEVRRLLARDMAG